MSLTAAYSTHPPNPPSKIQARAFSMSQRNSSLTETALRWSPEEAPVLRRIVSSFRPCGTAQDVLFLPNSPAVFFDLLDWGHGHLFPTPDDDLHRLCQSNLSRLAKTCHMFSKRGEEREEMCLAKAVLSDVSVIVGQIRSELGMDRTATSSGRSLSIGSCVQTIPLQTDSPAPRPQLDLFLVDPSQLVLSHRV